MRTPLFVLLLYPVGLTGCAVNGALPVGEYTETRGPGVALLSARQLRLYPNRQFEYVQWTDMEGAGQQGKGTYSLRRHRLQLVFDGEPSAPQPAVQAQPLPASPASDSVLVRVDLHVGQEAAEGLTVSAYDTAGRLLTSATSNSAGRADLGLPRTQNPHQFTVVGVGFQKVTQPWPLTSTAYRVHLAGTPQPIYPAGTTLSFRVLQQEQAKVVLRQGADTITFVSPPRP